MIKVDVTKLEGPALDWAMGKAEGITCVMMSPRKDEPKKPFALFGSLALGIGGEEQSSYTPSTCWHCLGPLIEKHHIQLSYNGNHFSQSPTGKYWCAYVCKPSGQEERPSGGGPTPLIAACRAIVARKFGDYVEIPNELQAPYIG